MPEPLLQLEGIRRAYGTRVITEALRGVDLTVARGEFAAVVGPSGSGKSTLLNIVGLLDRPTGGRYRFGGTDTNTLAERDRTRFRGRRIGFVFQFHHLLPGFTAAENVYLPLAVEKGYPGAPMRARARILLKRMGLTHRLDYRSEDLSGGERQRVAVARALVTEPDLVLADEPTGNLDTESSDAVFDLLREVHREQGTCFLIVTHDRERARYCDRTITLVDGRIHPH